jgi:hypothetical protein
MRLVIAFGMSFVLGAAFMDVIVGRYVDRGTSPFAFTLLDRFTGAVWRCDRDECTPVPRKD